MNYPSGDNEVGDSLPVALDWQGALQGEQDGSLGDDALSGTLAAQVSDSAAEMRG